MKNITLDIFAQQLAMLGSEKEGRSERKKERRVRTKEIRT